MTHDNNNVNNFLTNDNNTFFQEICIDSSDSLNVELSKLRSVRDLLLMHTNIRSLNSNFENLESLIEINKVRPDIIVCTEQCWAILILLDRYSSIYNVTYMGALRARVTCAQLWY